MARELVHQSSEFGRRRASAPGVPHTKALLILSILVSIAGGILLFFVKPYFVFGPILLVVLIAVVIKYPISGLYLYMLIIYLRPQDLFNFLAILRPNIFILALTVISLVIHRKLEGKTHLTLLPNDKMFLAFMVAAVLSNVTSFWFSSSIETTIELLKISVFYFIAIMLLNTRKRLKTYMVLYLLSMGFVSLVQIWTYLTVGLNRSTGKGGYGIIVGGTTIFGGGGPLRGSAEGVNGVGGYSTYFLANSSELGLGLCVTYPLCFYLFKGTSSRLLRFICLVLLVMFVISIIFTGSRGAFVGFVGTLLYMLYKQKKLLIGLVFMAVLSPLAIFIASDQYVERIESITDVETDQSIGIRLQLWRAAVDMVADYPIFGVGTGNFPNAYGSVYRAKGSASLYWSPHNVFIQIVTEMGLVGFSVYLLFLGSIFWINYKSRRLLAAFDDEKLLYYMSQAVDVLLIGYIVAGQFITATYYPHVFQFSVWASAIYLVARKRAKRHEAELEAAA